MELKVVKATYYKKGDEGEYGDGRKVKWPCVLLELSDGSTYKYGCFDKSCYLDQGLFYVDRHGLDPLPPQTYFYENGETYTFEDCFVRDIEAAKALWDNFDTEERQEKLADGEVIYQAD